MPLTDREIATKVNSGHLIKNGHAAGIGPACYELRMGSVYYDLTENDRRIEVPDGGNVLIKPGHRVVLITLEELDIPANFIARVISKGSLFSVGLSPVSTYADPGFSGNMGIVTQNISDKYIQLPVGEPIAKVDFSELDDAVDRPYQGQHGFKSQIWPIKHHLQRTYQEVRHDPRVLSEKAEALMLLPNATAELLRRMEIWQSVVRVCIFAAVVINGLILAAISTNTLSSVEGVIGNLIASAIVGIIVFVAQPGK